MSTVVFVLLLHYSSRGIKNSDAPESRMIRSPPAVILALDGGSCSGRMNTNLAYVCVGRVRVRRVR